MHGSIHRHTLWYVFDQRTICKIQFSPTTQWVPGIELKSLHLAASASLYLLSHLTGWRHKVFLFYPFLIPGESNHYINAMFSNTENLCKISLGLNQCFCAAASGCMCCLYQSHTNQVLKKLHWNHIPHQSWALSLIVWNRVSLCLPGWSGTS